MNVGGVRGFRQIEVHSDELLVPAIDMSIVMLKSYKSLGPFHIPAELIQAGGRIMCCLIHKLINFVWNKEELSQELKSIGVPIYKKCDKAICSYCHGTSLVSNTGKI